MDGKIFTLAIVQIPVLIATLISLEHMHKKEAKYTATLRAMNKKLNLSAHPNLNLL
jgi:hypothetical protein